MDIFGEQLLQKKASGSDWAKRILLIVGALLLSTVFMALSFATGFMVLILLSVGILFGAVWLLPSTSIEYEYIVTNEDLDIDKIVGRRTRKRLITLKMNTVQSFGAYDGTQGDNAAATVLATDGTNENNYYIIANHKKHGLTMLIFSPDRRMASLILSALPHKVKLAAKSNLNFTPEEPTEE